jgi:outer membrane protein assembly factor BamB
VKDGLVYAADLAGFLNCLDAATGKLHWKHNLDAAVWGSPYWVDGKVYIGDEDGEVAVFKAGPTLEEIAVNSMDNAVYSTPVAANGVLYVMNRKNLYAIAEKP